MTKRRDKSEISEGTACHITHEIVIEGRLAFARDEKVFVDAVETDAEGAQRYVVTSKTMNFRQFRLSRVDLSARQVGGSRPRVPSLVSRVFEAHRVAAPVVTGLVILLIAAGILYWLYGFQWTRSYNGKLGQMSVVRATKSDSSFAMGTIEGKSVLMKSKGTMFTPVGKGEGTFRDVAAVDGSHAWVVTSEGKIYFFNGTSLDLQHDTLAQTWTGAIADELSGVYALDSQHVWAVGTFRRWSLIPGFNPTTSGVTYFFDGASWTMTGTLPPNSELIDVTATDPSHVWAASKEGGIFFFNGSGWALQAQTNEKLTAISAADPKHVWAVSAMGNDKTGKIIFFDGLKWRLATRVANVNFKDACALDAKHVWVVGVDTRTLVPEAAMSAPNAKLATNTDALWYNAGSDWKLLSGPPGSDLCTSVCAISPGSIWVVARGSVYRGANGF